jgi:hypothetical protein
MGRRDDSLCNFVEGVKEESSKVWSFGVEEVNTRPPRQDPWLSRNLVEGANQDKVIKRGGLEIQAGLKRKRWEELVRITEPYEDIP